MIYVIGSINLDLVSSCQRLPLVGETVIGNKFSSSSGGKGANQALAAKRAGAAVKMIGAVGNDSYAEKALKWLKEENIDLTNISKVDENTGIATINLAKNGENSIIIIPGANSLISPQIAKKTIEQMSKDDILLLVQEIPAQTIKTALIESKKRGIMSILNIAPFIKETNLFAPLADIIIANESEFASLLNIKPEDIFINLEEKLQILARKNKQTIIVTLGERGSVAASGGGDIYRADALKIDAIDCVGAGDSFCGYFAAMIERGEQMGETLKIASIAGSIACTKYGAQPAIPYFAEVSKKI